MRINARFARRLGIPPAGDAQLRFLAEAGHLWLELNFPAKAAVVFQGLTLLAPNDPVGFLGLAELYLGVGRWQQAAACANRAVACANTDRQALAYAYFLLSQAAPRLGGPHEAEALRQKALALDGRGCVGALVRSYSEETYGAPAN